jgi:hypothetical protein
MSAAQDKKGTSKKQPLLNSPIVTEFEYGVTAQGHWTCDHMVLQFKDCVDVIKVLFCEFEYIFLFDHSCGHDRNRPDGLCVNSIRKGFGGKQSAMRDTMIASAEYLGPFGHAIEVGMYQKMFFASTDVGPFWLSPEERESNRNDSLTGKTIKRSQSKGDLLKDLQAKGVSAKGTKDELQIFCKNKDIMIAEELDEVVEGWNN